MVFPWCFHGVSTNRTVPGIGMRLSLLSPRMNEAAIQKKWDSKHSEGRVVDARPCWLLEENVDLLPSSGSALDLACGLGGNAVLMANHGLAVSAWDISEVAVAKLRAFAREQNLNIEAETRSLFEGNLGEKRFDVIVVAHFLDRALAPEITEALKPGGLLLYQTFTLAGADSSGPKTSSYRLGEGELPQLFSALRVQVHHEPGQAGYNVGRWGNKAGLIARKPPLG